MQTNDIIAYTHPYIHGIIDDYQFNIIIDSGAQISMFSSKVVDVLGLNHLVDKKTQIMIKGVGQQRMIGSIRVNLKINNLFIPLTITIIDTDDFIFLIGLDFLYAHNCTMDFQNRNINIFDMNVKFLNEIEIQDGKIPFNVTKANLQYEYRIVQTTLPVDAIQLLRKIINNIIENPVNDKFKQINKNGKTFQKIQTDKCNEFLKAIGFIENGDKLKFCGELDKLKYIKEIISN